MTGVTIPAHLAHPQSNPWWVSMSPQRQQAILDGAAAMRLHHQGLQRVFAIGRAFHEMQVEAMLRSNSGKPSGRRYSDAYAGLEMPVPDLARINKTDRNQYIWCYQNQAALAAWWGLPENAKKRDKWTHPDAIKRNFQAAEQRRQRGADAAGTAKQQARAAPAAGHGQPTTAPAATTAAAETVARLRAEITRLTTESARLTAEIARLQAAQADDAALRAQIASLTRERDNRVAAADYWERVREVERLTKELANARLASGFDKTSEAAVAKLVRERDRLQQQITRLEARLADDPGENAKLVKMLNAAQTRIRNMDAGSKRLRQMYDDAQRKLRATPVAGLSKSEWAVLRKYLHPESAPLLDRQQMTEAAQVLNKLLDKLDPPPPQPLKKG